MRQVGYKVAVHHVHVDGGAAAPLGRGNLVGQMGKVRGEDGGQQLDHREWCNSLRGQCISEEASPDEVCGSRHYVSGRLAMRQHRDVVLLSELDRRFCDLFSKLRADFAGAIETEKLASRIARLDDRVRLPAAQVNIGSGPCGVVTELLDTFVDRHLNNLRVDRCGKGRGEQSAHFTHDPPRKTCALKPRKGRNLHKY